MITIFAVLTVLSALTFIAQKRLALHLYRYLATKLIENRSMGTLEGTTENARIDTDELKSKRRKNFNPVACVNEIKHLENQALIFALMCCFLYAATMIGLFHTWAMAQAIIATLGLVAAATYSFYFRAKKSEALIAIEVPGRMPDSV